MRATRDLALLSPPHIVWRRRVFASTWLCYAGMYFCRKPFYITKSALGDSLGMSASTLGTIGAVYLVCHTCGQFLSGYFGNRLGQRVTLLSGMGSIGTVFQELIIGRMYDSGGGSLGPILVVLFGASGLAALALVVIVVRNRLGISDV